MKVQFRDDGSLLEVKVAFGARRSPRLPGRLSGVMPLLKRVAAALALPELAAPGGLDMGLIARKCVTKVETDLYGGLVWVTAMVPTEASVEDIQRALLELVGPEAEEACVAPAAGQSETERMAAQEPTNP